MRRATKKHSARTTKTAASKRAARKRASRRRHTRPADPLSKALVGATNAEETAVNSAGQVGHKTIDTFQNVSRKLLGMPITTRKSRSKKRAA